MRTLVAAIGLLALIMVRCDCSDDSTTNPPDDNPSNGVAARIDSTLWGTWDSYSAIDQLLDSGHVRISRDSIVVGDLTLTGMADTNPTFARTLVAEAGQVYFDPAAAGLPNDYRYDYTHMAADSLLYLLAEHTEQATAPLPSTHENVLILRRHRQSVAPPELAVIDPALLGVWDQYDSTGTTVKAAGYLVITPDSVVVSGFAFKGATGDGIARAQTFRAQNGQMWRDYQSDAFEDLYVFDYTLSGGGSTMYFIGETTPNATNPDRDTPLVMLMKKR